MSKEQPFAPVSIPKKPAATVRVADPELQALNRIGAVLNGLDIHARQRVLAWINSRYQLRIDAAHELPNGPVPHGMD